MLAVGFHHLDQKQPPVVRSLRPDPGANIPQLGEEKRTGPWLNGQVAVLHHPASHFFVGIGPSVSEDIVHTTDRGPQNRRTAYGASTIIGGWL